MESKIISNTKESAKESNEKITEIKKDISKLIRDLGDLKDGAMEALMEDGEQLISSLIEIKDKVLHQGKGASTACWYIQRYPMRSIIYTFAAGIMLTIFLRK